MKVLAVDFKPKTKNFYIFLVFSCLGVPKLAFDFLSFSPPLR